MGVRPIRRVSSPRVKAFNPRTAKDSLSAGHSSSPKKLLVKMTVSPTLIPDLAALPLTPVTSRPPPAALDCANLRPRGLSISTWRFGKIGARAAGAGVGLCAYGLSRMAWARAGGGGAQGVELKGESRAAQRGGRSHTRGESVARPAQAPLLTVTSPAAAFTATTF